jgi:hypothetical protein
MVQCEYDARKLQFARRIRETQTRIWLRVLGLGFRVSDLAELLFTCPSVRSGRSQAEIERYNVQNTLQIGLRLGYR